MLLNNEWVNNEIKEEIERYLGTNENENTTIQNPWGTAKAALRGKFIALQAYLKKRLCGAQYGDTAKIKNGTAL